MNARPATILSLLCIGGAALLSCGEPSGPLPDGSVNIVLSTPNDAEGAILFNVTGPPGLFAPPNSETTVIWARVGDNEVNVAVMGEFGAGPIAVFDPPDQARIQDYEFTVLEVADVDNIMRLSTTGYSVDLEN